MPITGFSQAFAQWLRENFCQGLKRPNSETDYIDDYTNDGDDDNDDNNNNNNNMRSFDNIPLTLVNIVFRHKF
jgi:hypothetical protein